MNISSENIVDVFLRKISESLPVGERDEYQAWKKRPRMESFSCSRR